MGRHSREGLYHVEVELVGVCGRPPPLRLGPGVTTPMLDTGDYLPLFFTPGVRWGQVGERLTQYLLEQNPGLDGGLFQVRVHEANHLRTYKVPDEHIIVLTPDRARLGV